MSLPIQDITLGYLLMLTIGYYSLIFNFLTVDGVLVSVLMGFVILTFGGLDLFILVLLFLIIGSLLTRLGKSKKPLYEKFQIGSVARRWENVVANGFWPTISTLLMYYFDNSSVWLYFFLGSLITMMADTSATEIGLLSKSRPRLLYKPSVIVEPGVSGGVTLLGLLSSILVAIAFTAFALALLDMLSLSTFVILILASTLGNLSDSLIGGLLQAKYKCVICKRITEHPIHCNIVGVKVGGFDWMDNHMVNFLSSLLGGLYSILLLFFLSFTSL